LAKADAEATARARDEALRMVEYAKKEREDAVQVADQALKQAQEAAQQRQAAVDAAQVAQADRDQARAQALAAQQARDTAQRVSQELQRQRLTAYEESRVARLEAAETRQSLAVAERLADERRRSLELFRSAEHQWSQFAVQLASAAGIKDPLPRQEERWATRESVTQAWLDKVRVRYAQILAPVARPSDGDRTAGNFSYVEGLRHLRQQDYRAAVQRFSEAIDRYPHDARYFYLRGLARHLAADGSDLSEADRDVRRGAELEKQSSPSSRVVDQALERFQGAPRLWIEKLRQ
jgi:TolA-binding protein